MNNILFLCILLFLAGIVLLIRILLNVDFALLRVLTGILLILIGVKIIFSAFTRPFKTGDNEFLFRSETIDVTHNLPGKYQLVLSKINFDLGEAKRRGKKIDMKIRSLFSGSTVYLPDDLPFNIEFNAIFSSVRMPERISAIFGRGSYSSDDFDPDMPHLNLNVKIVFGNVTLMYEP